MAPPPPAAQAAPDRSGPGAASSEDDGFFKAAAPLHDSDSFQHQPSPCCENPAPTEGSQQRGPASGRATRGVTEPVDDGRRANCFGSREQRWKLAPKAAPPAPETTLDEIRFFLTKKFGTLKRGFDGINFFQDGKLSAIEWREGVHKLLTESLGEQDSQDRLACMQRGPFNDRMQKLFASMDLDNDGLISFHELSKPYLEPSESIHGCTRRRKLEKVASEHEKLATMQSTMLMRKNCTRLDADERQHTQGVESQGSAEPCEFISALLKSFSNMQAAFDVFDVSGNGRLTMAEFRDGARSMHFYGNSDDIFKELDTTKSGTISRTEFLGLRKLPGLTMKDHASTAPLGQTKRDLVATRRLRSPRHVPPPHSRARCLESDHIVRPLGEKISSSAGFHSFSRLGTGRLDCKVHPNALPGTDSTNFDAGHGPGFCRKAPPYFSEVGCMTHPLQGNRWKLGATMNRTDRFGPIAPSKQGQEDRCLSSVSYMSYVGCFPNDGWAVSKTGANSFPPKVALGERIGLSTSLRSQSDPTLLCRPKSSA